jgi:hypothetical protein
LFLPVLDYFYLDDFGSVAYVNMLVVSLQKFLVSIL